VISKLQHGGQMDPQRNITIKLISPWLSEVLVYDDVKFDPNVSIEDADGALWDWSIDERIFDYRRVKGWHMIEPSWHSMYRTRLYRRAKKYLQPNEVFYFAHENLDYRIPHITHYNEFKIFGSKSRKDGCVAVVSNTGGLLWFRYRGFRLRNKFVTNERVELFGVQREWERFYKFGFKWSIGAPKNYRGQPPSQKWGSEIQVEFLSRFKVAICLENTSEPYYFTEKFYNAARAGCIPIYHAHPTLRTGVLRGASYVDPGDYCFDPDKTIDAALSMNIDEVQAHNEQWLNNPIVRQTSFEAVWSRMAAILRCRYDARTP
jgi:hypothetical protein